MKSQNFLTLPNRINPEWILLESAGKNTHLEHIEDVIFNEGYSGLVRIIDFLDGLKNLFAKGGGDQVKITTKWDGAPAIICGIDPEDGKFFVGTKSVFNKDNPKLCKTNTQIRKWYAEQPGLQTKLEYALKYLKPLGIGNVLQGDLMFTPGDLEVKEVGGEQCLVFQPNTIAYAVPVNSELGQRISTAKIGIVFHTSYEGATVADMQASFAASVAGLNPSRDVWYDDAIYKDYTGRASFTPEEESKITAVIGAAKKTLTKIKQPKFDALTINNKEFQTVIKIFINTQIRSGEQIGEPSKFLKLFTNFYRERQEKEIAKLASERAQQTRLKKIEEINQFIADNMNDLLLVLAEYKRIVEAKILILSKIQKIDNLGTFVKTNDGYKVTNPEGFVAVGHDGGAVKLVDRLEFSRQNFTAEKNWSKT